MQRTDRWLAPARRRPLARVIALLATAGLTLLAGCASAPERLPVPTAQQVAASATPTHIQNAGFDAITLDQSGLPAGWFRTGNGASYALDGDRPANGLHSLRIEKTSAASFAGVGQAVDAEPWRGKVIELRASIRTAALLSGNNGLWLRIDDADRKFLTLRPPLPGALAGDSDWTASRIRVAVPDAAGKIVFGAQVGASGALWVDSFELRELSPREPPSLSIAAKRYLDTAIGRVRQVAMRSADIDWTRASRVAYTLAQDAVSTADTHQAIADLLSRLGDGHSYLLTPAQAAGWRGAGNSSFAISGDLLGRIAHVRVPGAATGAPDAVQRYADELHEKVLRLHAGGACGWIVDLRTNSGGNMYPMLAGLAPLLPDGQLGAAVGPTGTKRWFVSDGAIVNDEVPAHRVAAKGAGIAPLTHQGRPVPVAVLTGARTASSGEAVAISFIGRGESRRFGEPTMGLSTANTPIELPDGAIAIVTTGVMADRTGRNYGGRIEPDQRVTSSSTAAPPADPTLQAAIEWLDGRDACRSR